MTIKVTNPKAVVLLSGGLDSTTTLAIAASKGFDVYALTANYSQRHKIEIRFARRIAKKNEVIKTFNYQN